MKKLKHPRTPQEAFGPYTDNQVYSYTAKNRREDRLVGIFCVLAFITVVLICL